MRGGSVCAMHRPVRPARIARRARGRRTDIGLFEGRRSSLCSGGLMPMAPHAPAEATEEFTVRRNRFPSWSLWVQVPGAARSKESRSSKKMQRKRFSSCPPWVRVRAAARLNESRRSTPLVGEGALRGQCGRFAALNPPEPPCAGRRRYRRLEKPRRPKALPGPQPKGSRHRHRSASLYRHCRYAKASHHMLGLLETRNIRQFTQI